MKGYYMKGRFSGVLFLSLGILCGSCKNKEGATASPPLTNSSTPPGKEPGIIINLDKSPLDMSYFPVDYPKLIMSGIAREPLVARVIYSRPKKDGRIIFGNVVKYGSRWRLGANEASEIEFFTDVTIQNTLIKKNRYIIYCIPFDNKWTVILSKDLFTWGLKIDSTKETYNFDVPVLKVPFPMEYFTMTFEKADKGLQLVMAWDTIKAILPITD